MRILTPTILAALLLVACRETPAPEVATATETTIEVPTTSTMPAPPAPVTATETTATVAPPTSTTTPTTTNPRAIPPPTPFPVQSPEIVDRMPPQELSQLIAAGEAVVVDVRYADQYAASHIPGSISMPLPELAFRANELPRGKLIVAYCT
ncbi:MAG: rhodanese-like domain-containing protein [Thermoanaerobaculia bacterium]